MEKEIFLCAINTILSGTCLKDYKFYMYRRGDAPTKDREVLKKMGYRVVATSYA